MYPSVSKLPTLILAGARKPLPARMAPTVAGLVIAAFAIASSLGSWSCSRPGQDAPVSPVPFSDIRFTDDFWAPRLETTRTVTMPYLLDLAESSGRALDMRLVEAASAFLRQHPDPDLQARVESRLGAAIERIRGRMEQKWPTAGDGSLSGAGSFFLGAVAHHKATGNRILLDAAIEIANDIEAAFGPGKRRDIANHEGLKMGLVSLFRHTGEQRYLRLAEFMLSERGYAQAAGRPSHGPYAQDHMPVKEQDRAIGHSVRATYLYVPLTDIATLTGDADYARASLRIWEDAVSRRTYLTGGVGSYRDHEDYGDDYHLPNLNCWNEICAACGSVWWNHRLFLAHLDSKFIDVMERTLYNGLLAGVSLSGDRFLYQTPLKSTDGFARQPRFGPNCCPPNITRLLASLGDLFYASDSRSLYVNLYASNRAQVELAATPVSIIQETGYPWEGAVRITIVPERRAKFRVFLRIPGWSRNEVMPGGLYRYSEESDPEFTLTVNDKPVAFQMIKGFALIDRTWAPGDVLDLKLPMAVRKVRSREEVADNRGMIALERGPLVYCAEGADNGGRVFNLVVPDDSAFRFAFREDLLGGIGTIGGTVLSLTRSGDGETGERREQPFTAVPFYAFGNRGPGEMAVWLAGDETRAEIGPSRTIASTARLTSSSGNGTFAENYPGGSLPTIAQRFYPSAQDGSGDIRAIVDQLEPVDSADGSSYFLRLRPQEGDLAWIQLDFPEPTHVSSVEIYWKDDRQYCPLPASWRLLYKADKTWLPADATGPYGVEKDMFNITAIDPVTTTALRIEIRLRAQAFAKGDLGPPDANWMSGDAVWYEGGVIECRVNK